MTGTQMSRRDFEKMIMEDPDLQKILALTQNPNPAALSISGYDLFVLVGALQMATRHPFMGEDTRQHIIHIARTLQKGFETIQPDIIPIMEASWNPALDVDQDGNPAAKEVLYQVWALYLDGLEEGDTPMAEYHRPQDWGNPRWTHRVYTFETEDYRNIVHCWVDVKMEEHELIKTFAGMITMILKPGSDPQLCGTDFMDEDDFWDEAWGTMPPFADADMEDDFVDDLFVFIDPANDSMATEYPDADESEGDDDESD